MSASYAHTVLLALFSLRAAPQVRSVNIHFIDGQSEAPTQLTNGGAGTDNRMSRSRAGPHGPLHVTSARAPAVPAPTEESAWGLGLDPCPLPGRTAPHPLFSEPGEGPWCWWPPLVSPGAVPHPLFILLPALEPGGQYFPAPAGKPEGVGGKGAEPGTRVTSQHGAFPPVPTTANAPVPPTTLILCGLSDT